MSYVAWQFSTEGQQEQEEHPHVQSGGTQYHLRVRVIGAAMLTQAPWHRASHVGLRAMGCKYSW
jgi:hypothetical protein